MRYLVLFFALLLATLQGGAQVTFAETLGFVKIGLQQQDTIFPIENSETFYGTPHLLENSSDHDGLECIPRNVGQENDWVLFLVILAMISIGIARYSFGSRLGNFLRATFGASNFNQMERDGGFFNEAVTYLLFFNFLIVFSLLIWQSLMFFERSPRPDLLNPLLLFFLTLFSISVFSLLKSVLLGFIAWVFNTRQATLAYLKNIFLFNQIIGLILIPMVVYLVYKPSSTAMLFTWSFWFLANLAKLVRGISIGHGMTSFPKYYLILYLCSIELAPLLLIIKLGSMYLLVASPV